MKLRDLHPSFLRRAGGVTEMTDVITGADGVVFLCPACYRAHGGPTGTHVVICWSPSVPADVDPGPGRWSLVGTGYDDLSLVAGSSSVLTACWHGWVRGGEVTP